MFSLNDQSIPDIITPCSKIMIPAIGALPFAALVLLPAPLLAQIIPNSTWGTENSIVTPNILIKNQPATLIEGGASRGSNLFHSFQTLNIGSNQRLYFANPTGIQNIFTRVINNLPTTILGTLGVTGNANLFLLNPSGITLGANTQLDLNGSFIATTASRMQFDRQGFFEVNNPQAPALLTVQPSALFVNSNPATIASRNNNLQIAPQQSLLLIAGAVALDNSKILAPAGRIELAGIIGNDAIGLQFNRQWQLRIPDTATKGNVTLINGAEMNVRSNNGGDITVTANNLNLTGANTRILAGIAPGGTPASQAGDITLNLAEAINLDASRIENSVLSSGNGGLIQVQTGSLTLQNGARLATSTFGQGNAGAIDLQVRDRIAVLGFAPEGANRRPGRQFVSGVISQVEPAAIGNAGDLTINTGSLLVQDGAILSAETQGRGDAGKIKITAREQVILDDIKPPLGSNVSGIFTSVSNSAVGNGADIDITAKSLQVSNGAAISAVSFGWGNAGNININVQEKAIWDGTNERNSSGFPSIAESFVAKRSATGNPVRGDGGMITVNAKNVFVTNGARLTAAIEAAPGKAGSININAQENVVISGSSLAFGNSSGLFTDTVSNSSGNTDAPSGKIDITANRLEVSQGGILNARSDSQGRGGDILINVNEFDVLTGGKLVTTAFRSGNAGDMLINVRDRLQIAQEDSTTQARLTTLTNISNRFPVFALFFYGLDTPVSSLLVSSQGSGAAGTISINARSLQLRDRGQITAETKAAQGGNILLNLQDTLSLRRNSLISTTAGTAGSGGNGGNILINAETGFIISVPNENSDITANAFSGRGGRVEINSLNIFGLIPRSRSDLEQTLRTSQPSQLQPNQLATNDITAISQTSPALSGTVALNTPDLDATKDLRKLPEVPIDAANLINPKLCALAEGSQFIIAGRGGLPHDPANSINPDVVWEDWRTSSTEAQTEPITTVQTASPVIREAQGWIRRADRRIQFITTPSATASAQVPWHHHPHCQKS
jgi:filamentous hemagglutinin family protein